ncbi:hypothetical protein TNIN_291131 [Trichonephila inaurata madagascariensis]|uniref:Uncharacterized protein n=1 Tax=Trichonephila inaurata madagascariensis TaxID=2747483 RepID=A0A8X7BNE2_9ARAC|nr:hypothetical protein TNIN_291131 [Trichonephila inaurata madagascariensis]
MRLPPAARSNSFVFVPMSGKSVPLPIRDLCRLRVSMHFRPAVVAALRSLRLLPHGGGRDPKTVLPHPHRLWGFAFVPLIFAERSTAVQNTCGNETRTQKTEES